MFLELFPKPDEITRHYRTLSDHLQAHLNRTSPNSGGLAYLASPANYALNNAASKKAQLLVIGGSRTESTIFDPTTNSLTNHRSRPTPTLHSATEVLNLAKEMGKETDLLLLNFTFPIRPEIRGQKLDGRILRGSKQHRLTGLHGALLGEHLESNLWPDKTISVANDTTILLSAFRNRNIEIAGILGTGFNFGLLWKRQFVNLEIGNFQDFEPSRAVLELDRKSPNPNQHLWEKSISGKYLDDHFNFWAQEYDVSDRVEGAHELDELTTESGQALAEAVYRQSASKTAATVAALLATLQARSLVLEGSVFWKAKGYQSYTREYLNLLGYPEVTILESRHPFHNLASLLNNSL